MIVLHICVLLCAFVARVRSAGNFVRTRGDIRCFYGPHALRYLSQLHSNALFVHFCCLDNGVTERVPPLCLCNPAKAGSTHAVRVLQFALGHAQLSHVNYDIGCVSVSVANSNEHAR